MRVQGLEFRGYTDGGFGFRVKGSEIQNLGLGVCDLGTGLRVYLEEVCGGSLNGVQVHGSDFSVWGQGSGSGFRM